MQQSIKRRVTDFESFDFNTASATDKTEYVFTKFLGPGLIKTIRFRVLPANHIFPKPTPIDQAFRLRVLLNQLVIGARNHISGPGILSPLHTTSNAALHVPAGEGVKLLFTHPPNPCRISGYIEIIHVTDP